MTYKTYQWTAFREADLLKSGDYNLNNGDSFTMPSSPTVTLRTSDNDNTLSDSYRSWWGGTNANDGSGQYAYIDGYRPGGQLYSKQYYVLQGSDGKKYYLVDIQVEHHDAPGAGNSYMSFYGDTPPAGVSLTVTQTCAVNGCWIDYNCLTADADVPANAAPTFTNVPSNGVFCIDENETLVVDLNASDADGDAVSYQITGGADAHLFEIDPQTGKLSFKDAPDYEHPCDANGDNVYDVNVQVSDGKGGTETKCLWVKVQDVAEATNTAPTFTNVPANGVLCVNENTTMVLDLDASDADGDVVTYKIVGGVDAHLFEIDPQTGKLTFKDAPDYEHACDANGDNVYDVNVEVSDGKGGTETKCLWVKVQDVAEVTNGVISGRFFVDADCNDSEWNAETCAWDEGVAGQKIELLDLNGNVVATTTTDGYGRYSFEVPEGDYRVRFPKQDGKGFSAQDKGVQVGSSYAPESNDSDADANGVTGVIHLTAGGQCDVDAGVKTCDPVSGTNCIVIEAEDMHLSGFTIRDYSDASGGKYVGVHSGSLGCASTTWSGDAGKCDVTITAWDASSRSWWSSASETVWLYVNGQCVGSYNLNANTNGWEDITFEDVMLNPGDKITIYAKGVNGTCPVIDKVKICCENTDPKTGKIGDKVFLDLDKDGIQDADEAGVAGVTVQLKDANGNVLATTTTDANGNYVFENLAAGDYKVSFVPRGDAANYMFTTANAGTNDAVDSDADANGNTGTISLAAGETNLTVDAGLKDPGTAKIEGRIFMDANDNDQDDSEMGVAGVTVTLLDASGAVVATTVTAADGSYSFAGLDAGDYKVDFPTTTADGKVLVNQNVGPDATDSDASQTTGETDTITVGVGETVSDVDAGVEDPGTSAINGRIFMDANDNDVDDAEMGVAGVTVKLLDANGNEVASTVTAADGSYSFTGLDAGDYVVDFPTATADGKVLVNQNAGSDDTIDSDASTTDGKTDTISVGIGETVSDVDAGVEDPGTAAINGRIFMDANDNDQDDNEMGVAGVTVKLLDANGNEVASTVTAADGSYSFANLDAGSYKVDFPTATADGKVLVNQNVGPDATDSDASQTTGETDTIDLSIGETVSDVDAGVEDPGTAAIKGRLFNDTNRDGLDNDGANNGEAGVTVTLLDGNGNTVGTTTTDANGNYSFEGLDAGDYVVKFPDEVNGKKLTNANVGSDDTIDSDANQTTGQTGVISLNIGETSEDNDAGVVVEKGSLSGRYFEDQNNNDVQDAGEPGVAGVQVGLFDANGQFITSTTTDANGNYSFGDLEPGTYGVKFFDNVTGGSLVEANQGSDDTIDSDAVADLPNPAGLTSKIDGITVVSGQDTPNNDAGIEKLGSIAGKVFMDNDDNSVESTGDMDVSGVTVILTDANGAEVARTTTGTDGSYSFTDLPAGDYTVTFDESTTGGKTFVDPNVGNDDTVDSDANPTNGTVPVTVTPGETVSDVDAGVEDPGSASLAGRIFMDANDNDVDDAEMGVQGVVVKLLNAAGTVVATTTTAPDGSYSFTGLDAGTYVVEFPTQTLDGKVLVNKDAGTNDAIDSDASKTDGKTDPITLTIGQDVTDVDAGVEDPGTASLGDRVFFDKNGNGVQDAGEEGLANVTVTLTDEDGATTTTKTDANGDYLFDGLDAGDYKVTVAKDGEAAGLDFTTQNAGGNDANDSDVNSAGVSDTVTLEIGEADLTVDAGLVDPGSSAINGRIFMDANDNDVDDNEMGVAGVTVTLLDANGAVVATTTTAPDGSYSFNGLDAGSYKVDFPTATADGKVLVNQNAGSDDTIDSDANQTTGQTGVISLNIGETSEDNDAGLVVEKGSLSGRYFQDLNDNDVQDADEPGVEGVKVGLFDESGTTFLGETTTDANGEYSFGDLAPGKYTIRFLDGVTGGALVGANVGSNDAIDSDAVFEDQNASGLISRIDGIEVVANQDTPNNDAGVEDPGTASIGDTVWLDNNRDGIRQGTEAGVAGVAVTLTGAGADGTFGTADDISQTTTTDANGNYLFSGLDAGDYKVTFGTKAGTEFTTASAAAADASDNDSDANTTTGTTGTVTLSVGEAETKVDAGLVETNNAPTPEDDEGMTCANKAVTVKVLENDTDADAGDTLTVTAVNGQSISAGQTVIVNGVQVSLVDGALVFNGSGAYTGTGATVKDLAVGEKATVNFTYTVSDGTDTATANAAVTFCGTADTVEELCASLPDTVNYQIRSGYDLGNTDAYDIKITSTDARFNGLIVTDAYCVDLLEPAQVSTTFDPAKMHTANIYCIDEVPPSVLANQVGSNGQTAQQNLDNITWIMNQDFSSQGYTDADVQAAVWKLTNNLNFVNGGAVQSHVDDIVARATVEGEGYVAGAGDTVALVIDPNPAQPGVNEQPFILGVKLDDVDCLC